MSRRVTTLAAAVGLTLVAVVAPTLLAGPASAYWSAGSTPGGSGAAAATTVDQGATPSASASGQSVTVSWAATTLASGQPVAGYRVKRFDSLTSAEQTVGSGCAGVVTSTSCVEANVPGGTWRYSITPVIGDNWRGAESTRSSGVVVLGLDLTPPANSLSLSSVTGGAHLSGTTVYYRGSAAGGFRVTNAVSDAGSGPASSSTGLLSGIPFGWTHTPSTVSTPAGGPYVSNPFAWGAGTSSGTGVTVTGRDVAGNAASTTLSFVNDSTAPTAGTVTYADGSTSGSTVSVSFTTGTDAGSGIGTRLLQRASAPLSGTTCGTYGGFATVSNGTDPTSPVTDTIAPGSCYKYRYVVTDRVGNQHVATSSNVAHTAYGAHWTFDQGSGTTATDSTGNGNTATLQGGASWTAGRIGAHALALSGASNSFASTTAPVIDTSRSYSVVAWVRPSTVAGGNQSAVSLDGSAISPFYLQVAGGQYRFQATTADSTSTASASTATGVAAAAGTWAHLAAVHDDAANTISLYVDGVLRGTAAFNSPWKANGATTIGRALWGGVGIDHFNGAVDDVRLYDRALSASEVDELVPQASYVDTITGTAGLLSHYRLGELTTSSDAMSGSTGASLQSRTGEIGASWTKHGLSDGDAVLTDAGRLRKGGTTTWNAVYHASGAPASADYIVEADVHVASNLADDQAGVVGRMDPTPGVETYYLARYEQAGQNWALYRRVDGSWDWLGASAQPLAAGATHRLALDMTGTSIRVLVDGVQRIAVTDGGISAAGRGGVALGLAGAATTVTDTSGLHLDDFRISPPLTTSKGTNHGDYFGGVALGATGAIAGDADTAATFDGTNDFGSVTRQIADDFSVELWFRSTQGIGTGTQWWSGAGLVDAEVAGSANDFGISLRSDGRVVAGVGAPDVSVVSSSGGFNDGDWHHVVFTRSRSSGALTLYVDGVPAGTATGSTLSLTSSSTISFGRVQGGSHLAGSLDEVALYDTVLSAATVAAHHAAGAS